MKRTAPAALKIRLPSGSRRTCGAALAVASMARMPLPMLAPITRPSATVTGITPEVASVATSSTTARLE